MNMSKEGISSIVTSLREHIIRSKQPSRMSPSVSVASILLALIYTLLPSYGFTKLIEHIGEKCFVGDSPGTCEFAFNCTSLIMYLKDKKPVYACAHLPLICCVPEPVATESRPTSVSTTTIQTKMVQPLTFDPKITGSLARAICAENAKAAYRRENSLIERIKNATNVPQCVQKSGRSKIVNRVVNTKEFPHVAILGYSINTNTKYTNIHDIVWHCIGSLISAKIILTSAHCTYSTTFGYATFVKIGFIHDYPKDNEKTQIIKIKEIIMHPEQFSKYNNIAILRLEQEAIYNDWVKPACLPVELPEDNEFISIGWNQYNLYETMFKASRNCKERYIEMEIYHPSYKNGDDMDDGEYLICSKIEERDMKFCQINQNGLLVDFTRDHECMYDIIGITNNRYDICPYEFIEYTRVQHYISWIEQTAWPEYFNASL